MSNNFNKILYLGAWEHIEIVDYFPNCNEFILIDTQPRTQWECVSFSKEFYQKNFIEVLINKCKDYGFILDIELKLDNNMDKQYPYINPHLFLFKNTSNGITRIIKYYISTNIIYNMTPILEKDIIECDTLYIGGYHPDKELLKYIKNKINFIGDDETLYSIDGEEDDKNSIIYNFITNNINDYFDNYYLVYRKSKNIIKCDNLDMIIKSQHK
jgi:hypothetical protein